MIRIYSSPDVNETYAVKALLEENGIAAYVFNENVNRLPGSLVRATPNAWPAVHITDESRAREAKALIRVFEENQRLEQAEPSAEQPPWICAARKEENADSFEICWKCSKPR